MSKCGLGPEGYMARLADSDRRYKAGERQVMCTICCLWVWPSHVCEEHKGKTQTAAEWRRDVRRMQREAKQ